MRGEQHGGGTRREPTLNRRPVAALRILFVCLGNICRSPTAEAVLRKHAKAAGLEQSIVIDSAGTGNYHIGEAPDHRARSAAARRGYDLTALRARQVRLGDFHEFDYVLAMDEDNLLALKALCPPEHAEKLGLFTDFSSTGARTVPDPYGGGAAGFETALDLIEDSARGLLRVLAQRLQGGRQG
jgi:protein-tyrosine phosphatase